MGRLINQYKFIVVGTLLFLATSCVNDDDDGNVQAPEQVINKALSLVSGTVTEIELDEEDDVLVWEIEITTDQGAEVEIYCRQDNGALVKIEGESGPFDYNIDPGNSLIDFDQAKTIAAGESSGDLEEWELEMEDDFDNIWVYQFEYSQSKVYVNAVDGNVLEVEN